MQHIRAKPIQIFRSQLAANKRPILWHNRTVIENKFNKAMVTNNRELQLDIYEDLLKRIKSNYDVKIGRATMYYTRTRSNLECEIINFKKPQYVYTARIADVINMWKQAVKDPEIYPPFLDFLIDEDEVHIDFSDINYRESPIDYQFELHRNDLWKY